MSGTYRAEAFQEGRQDHAIVAPLQVLEKDCQLFGDDMMIAVAMPKHDLTASGGFGRKF